MFKQFWEWFRQSLFVSRDIDELQKQFARMSDELEEHSQLIRDIVTQMKHERELHERDKRILMLELERELSKIERRLPPPRDEK